MIEIIHTKDVVPKEIDLPVASYRVVWYETDTENSLFGKFQEELDYMEADGRTKLYLYSLNTVRHTFSRREDGTVDHDGEDEVVWELWYRGRYIR